MIAIVTSALGLTVYCTNCSPIGLCTNGYSGVPSWQHVSGDYQTIPPFSSSFYNGWTVSTITGIKMYTGNSNTMSHAAGENFSENTQCIGQQISREYDPSFCPVSVLAPSGISYETTHINGQCWMKTNLKEIPSNFDINTTGVDTPPQDPNNIVNWGYYNPTVTNGTAGFGSSEPAANEGYLYTWKAAMNGQNSERARGICPTGWHIPSDCEFMYLEHGIGMSIAYQTGTRSDTAINQGDTSLKIRFNTNSGSVLGTNATGFSLLASGYRNSTGSFQARGTDMFLWTSTISNAGSPFIRSTKHVYYNIQKNSINPNSALSVRCLKD